MYKCILFSMLVTVLPLSYASATNAQNNESDGTPVDTVRSIFYLDGEQTTYQKVADEFRRNNIADAWGAVSKEAIIRYGEKARYGIWFFVTIKKEEDEK